MWEKNDLFLEGLRGEMSDLIHSCIGTIRIAQRQADSKGMLTAAEVNDRGERLIKMLTQLDYLKADFADLFYSREPGFALSLELTDISEQLELVCSSIQQQVRERGWESRVVLERTGVMYANLNPGYFYTICANIAANLYYYAPKRRDVHIRVTEERTVDIYMEGTALPEMVVELAQKYGETTQLNQAGVGVYGLLFAVQFCRAMSWQLTFDRTTADTHVILRAPAISISTAPREQLASEMALRVQQQNQAAQRVRRVFAEIFAE